jgi:hypothetical protein
MADVGCEIADWGFRDCGLGLLNDVSWQGLADVGLRIGAFVIAGCWMADVSGWKTLNFEITTFKQ